MKWFRHDTDANRDAKLEKVLMRYGAEGYALYWLCLELIAAPIDKSNITFELEHDSEVLAHRLKMDSARVEEIMRYMAGLDLFEIDATTQRITCLKLASRLENSIIKNPQLKQIQTLISDSKPEQGSEIPDNPGQSGKTSARSDQTRLEKEKSENKFTDADMETAEFMARKIKDLLPKMREPNFDKWADNVRLMRERDGRTDQEIRQVFEWANNDAFWQSNILSPAKLREQFDKLQLQMGPRDTHDDYRGAL